MKMHLLTIALALLWLVASGKELTQEEIEYKADFIIKVVDYVTWPDSTATNGEGVVVIGVVGESPLTLKLEELTAKRTDEDRKMKVEKKSLKDDLTACQILFVTTEDKTELAKILKKVGKAPVLTVSDSHYFARYGMMVNFYTEEVKGKNKIKFEVNTMTMGFAGLKMSSKLLKMATVI